MYEEDETPTVIELVADIIAAYVSNNNVPPSELGSLISGVHAALSGVDAPKAEEAPAKRTPPAPAPTIAIFRLGCRAMAASFDEGRPGG